MCYFLNQYKWFQWSEAIEMEVLYIRYVQIGNQN